DSKDCYVLTVKKPPKKDEAAKAAGSTSPPSSTSHLSPTEEAMMAQAAHNRTAAVRRPHHAPRPKITADDPWNPDTGATKHMTGNLKWLRNAVNVRVAVELANNELVWATKMGEVWFQPAVHERRTGRTIVFQ